MLVSTQQNTTRSINSPRFCWVHIYWCHMPHTKPAGYDLNQSWLVKRFAINKQDVSKRKVKFVTSIAGRVGSWILFPKIIRKKSKTRNISQYQVQVARHQLTSEVIVSPVGWSHTAISVTSCTLPLFSSLTRLKKESSTFNVSMTSCATQLFRITVSASMSAGASPVPPLLQCRCN